MYSVTYSVLNRYCCVNTVLIIEIDVLHTKPTEAALTTGSNVFRGTFYHDTASFKFDNPKFCGNLNFFSWQFLQCLGVEVTKSIIS